jgi:hypothetical protein
LFAAKPDALAAFYADVLGLNETGRGDDHIVLESPVFELVVHRTPPPSAPAENDRDRPGRRAGAAFKPVFFVRSLATVRTIAARHQGSLEPTEREWSFNGMRVCDGVDPEGNVIQFRER